MIVRILFLALAAVAYHADGVKAEIYGRWRVTDVADASPVTAMSSGNAYRLVGKYLFLSRRNVRFNGQTCVSPTYKATSEETTSFFNDQYNLDPKELGLPEQVTRVDAKCTDLFVKDPSHIVFDWNGFFFRAEKVKGPSSAQKRFHSSP